MKLHAEKHPECYKEIVHNKGFAGEALNDKPEIVRAVSSALTVFGIFLLFFCPENSLTDRIKKAGLAALIGGGLSNTMDRLIRHYVVDYIPKGKYVYNLGDFAIMAGAAGVAAGALLEKDGKEEGE